MKRFHLFEWEDLSYFPKGLRHGMQDYLSWISRMHPSIYASFCERFARALRLSASASILELCSGSGGPLMDILGILRSRHRLDLNATMSDLYPHTEAYRYWENRSQGTVLGCYDSVDARSIAPEKGGFRLMINGLHHFRPEDVRRILQHALESGQGFAAFEIVRRHPSSMFAAIAGVGLLLLGTPWVRPRRWSRFFWTYFVPLIPLATLWDGLVSCLRVYSPKELRDIVKGLEPNNFEWDIGTLRMANLPLRASYLIAYRPQKSALEEKTGARSEDAIHPLLLNRPYSRRNPSEAEGAYSLGSRSDGQTIF